MKILIVEPSQNVRELLKTPIPSSEHEITECSTAAEALQEFPRTLYSLVIINKQLPDMDGVELCRRLRKTPKGKFCLVLLLTEQERLDELHTAIRSGVDDYLLLPLEEDLLRLRWMIIERELQRIFERNKAMLALKPGLEKVERAKQEWEATADALTSVVCLLDNRGNIVRANRAIERWNLGDVHHIKGQPVHHLLHPECSEEACYLEEFLRQSWENLTHGISAEIEVEDNILHKDLHLQLQTISENPEKQLTKTESFAVLIVRDITTRKQTERQLQETSLELRKVFQSLPDEYFRLNANGSILDYKTDYDGVSSIGKTFLLKWASGLLPNAIEREFDTAVAHVLKTRMPSTMKYRLPVSGEGERYEEIRVFPFLDDQVLVVVRDMTEWTVT